MKPLVFLLCAMVLMFPALSTLAAESTLPPEGESDFARALTDGKLQLDARYRFEYVDQDGLPGDAKASTLRTRLGYETGKFRNFSALIEAENVSVIGNDSYNNTINGKTQYPIVADIADTQINQAYLAYSGWPQTKIIAGRQVLALDNQRWVGPGSWRQNEQTHDAISVVNTSLENSSFFYAYSRQVNRTLSERSPLGTWNDSNIHLLNVSYSGFGLGKLTGYGYLLDIPDAVALSTATYGARLEGKQPLAGATSILYAAEYARQSNYAGNTADYDLRYYTVESGIHWSSWTLKALYESVGSNGTQAVQFPIATVHTFDGWVDKFITTPTNGLDDAAISITYIAKSDDPWLNGTKAQLAYHDFSAERGSTHYGTEWDASCEQTFKEYYTAGIQVGSYTADNLFTDTVKVMPYIQVKF